MKRLLSWLLILALCLSLSPAVALAEEPEDARTSSPGMISVHASVPESWTGPRAWAWADGRSVFDQWPGEPMVQDGDWYSIQIPAWASYFIVNANEGTVQTADLSLEQGKEAWITVQEDGSAELSFTSPEPAASGTCGDTLSWTVDGSGILTISGTGDMWDFVSEGAPWYSIRDDIYAVILPSGVTGIGAYAFENCGSLTCVTIPAGVTGVGDSAFGGCSAMTWIRFEGSAPGFGASVFEGVSATAYYPAGDDSWTEDLRQSCGGSISWEAFGAASETVSVHASVPESWTGPCAWAWADGRNVFDQWPGAPMEQDGDWYSIQIPVWACYFIVNANEGTVQTADLSIEPGREVWIVVREDWSAEVFYEQPGPEPDNQCGDALFWTLEDGVLTISGTGNMWDWSYDGAPWYDSRSEITAVEIQSGATSIGNFAFEGCSALTRVTIPEGVSRLGNGAFDSCLLLTDAALPESLRSIGNYAFGSCHALTDLEIPENVTSIGHSAFIDCRALSGLTIPGGVTSIEYQTFYGCRSFTEMTIPENVTSIGLEAFAYCSSLTGITIPGSVTSIGIRAFECCGALAELTILPGVQCIEYEAFSECSSLTGVTIPGSVSSIQDLAFSFCTGLTKIRFEGAAPTMGNRVFLNVTATAYYPEGDETWTEDVMQDYGGKITWVSYEPAPDHTPGDVNGDGQVNTADVALLAKYVKARGQGVTADAAALDVNGDGQVNTADVALLAKFVKARGQGVVIH